jgi:uncharacterized membrane protein
MPTPPPPPPARNAAGAGGPLVLALLAGIVIGFLLGQPTIGFLVGAAAGVAIAVVLWLRDRGRDSA